MSFIYNVDKAIAAHTNKKKQKVGSYHALPFGHYLRDMVYGANDGIITTFAVVAGVSGASLDPSIVVILGVANLLADGFAMATGNYLGTKSEQDFQRLMRVEEEWEVEHIPECEKDEIREIYKKKGFQGKDLDRAVIVVTQNKKQWVQEMLKEEHGIFEEHADPWQPVKNGAATFVAFALAGSVPLTPYFFLRTTDLFNLSIVFTGVTLFMVGALRVLFTKRSVLRSGFEMLFVGAFAAFIAYFIGEGLKGFSGS